MWSAGRKALEQCGKSQRHRIQLRRIRKAMGNPKKWSPIQIRSTSIYTAFGKLHESWLCWSGNHSTALRTARYNYLAPVWLWLMLARESQCMCIRQRHQYRSQNLAESWAGLPLAIQLIDLIHQDRSTDQHTHSLSTAKLNPCQQPTLYHR